MIVLKLTLVPFFLFIVSMAAVRWGPAVAGWLAGLPIVAGPILYLLVLERGAVFGVGAAAAALSAVFASEAFNLAYGWTCRWYHYSIAAMMGLLAWLVAAIGLTNMPATPAFAVGAALLGVAAAQTLLPRTEAASKIISITRVDLMLRMAAGAVLTLAVTMLSLSLGAQWSGVLTVFPLLGLILSVSSQRAHGPDFVVRLLRGMVLGRFSFAAFCLCLVWMLPKQNAEIAFLVSSVAAVIVQSASRQLAAVGR
ncbi:hypothetical protein OIU34_02185 [Pararhizobium sp. BT-229]|uniref:hypothetical protein n=1 Tax=Pararhizobium sp. BT-229 TaxID=2986923 RepID=UPI0021F7CBE1|nr:hypothetical protein [Pararhizobium sp. BT-229]MCV9960695.1 hypothetical protein [Pararhizobium sp. BT-229]